MTFMPLPVEMGMVVVVVVVVIFLQLGLQTCTHKLSCTNRSQARTDPRAYLVFEHVSGPTTIPDAAQKVSTHTF
jgi:hypothetical protein